MGTQNWSDKIVMVDLENDPEFTDELSALTDRLANEPKSAVLNFANVKFINSSNVSLLLKLRKVLLDQGQRLHLCSIPVQVWGVFLLTGLDSIFDVSEDTSTALASLQINHTQK